MLSGAANNCGSPSAASSGSGGLHAQHGLAHDFALADMFQGVDDLIERVASSDLGLEQSAVPEVAQVPDIGSGSLRIALQQEPKTGTDYARLLQEDQICLDVRDDAACIAGNQITSVGRYRPDRAVRGVSANDVHDDLSALAIRQILDTVSQRLVPSDQLIGTVLLALGQLLR